MAVEEVCEGDENSEEAGDYYGQLPPTPAHEKIVGKSSKRGELQMLPSVDPCEVSSDDDHDRST